MTLTSKHILKYTHEQTLTTINLSLNQIGPQGGQHIGNALQTNQVTSTLLSNTPIQTHISTGTHHTQPLLKSNRRSRSTTHCQCSTNKQSNIYTSLQHTHTNTHIDRHSSHSTSLTMKSDHKEDNT